MRLLIFTAHPHYPGTYCAGTILNHKARGDEVFVVSITAGELVTNRFTPEELKVLNKEEAEKSAAVLGIDEFRILDFPDANIQPTEELHLAINNIIREFKPDTILTHYPEDTHPDLRNTGKAVIDSSFYALLVSGKFAEKFSSHWTGRLFAYEYPELSLGFSPNVFVDISNVVEKKRESILCFKVHLDSNFNSNEENFTSAFLSPNRYWGLQSGVLYAEPYQQIKIHEVHTKAVQYLT
jgi:N-acetylglucosamine malate deacetylase 1